MSSTGLTPADLIRRDRMIVGGSTAVLAAVCWLTLVSFHSPDMHASLAPHGLAFESRTVALTFAAWMVMMVAMMLPTVMPWVLLLGTISRGREGSAPQVSAALFVSGYLAVWGAYSLAAAIVQLALQQASLLPGAGTAAGPKLGGVILLTAGVFQWTPMKTACLRHCRSPLGFFLSRWRAGRLGAFRMGFFHGGYCVACCWALMALSFALGVMNLLWMAALTALLCVEKIAPNGDRWGRAAGVVFTVWGLALLLIPSRGAPL